MTHRTTLVPAHRGSATLLRCDAQALPLSDRSVALAVTSPPYFALREYQDGGEAYDGQIGSEPTAADFLSALWTVTDELWRVLRDDGSVWVNLGDKFAGSGGHNNSGIAASDRQSPRRYNQAADVRAKSRMLLPHRYALGCIDPDFRNWVEGAPPTRERPQWICRMDVVWSKPNGLPEPVADRVRASHEYWFHLVKSDRYYHATDTIREPHARPTDDKTNWKRLGNGDRQDGGFIAGPNHPLGKLPGSVWTVPLEPLSVPAHLPQHFAAFPQEWPRRLIMGWSPPGICTRCGEGRRPVVEVSEEYRAHREKYGDWNAQNRADGYDMAKGHRNGAPTPPDANRRIVGYACACDEADAATRPAVVLDPFGGTGTTAMVARTLGRHGVSVDLSADYLRLARWRIFESRHWNRSREAVGLPVEPKVDPNQLALFAET